MVILPNSVNQPDNIRTSFSGYAVTAAIGYAVIQNSRFRLYPYVGVTGFNTTLSFTDRTPANNMDDLLNNPHRTSKIHFSNASLDLGLQVEKLIPLSYTKWDCPQHDKYMSLGIRVGYNWSPGTVKASYNGTRLSEAPQYNFQGPYVKLTVGVGKKIRDLRWVH